MKQPLYIRAATALSPQLSFDPGQFLQEVKTSDTGKLFVVDPDYRAYISPVAIRRMSRLLKMAISTAMQCLKDSGVHEPDAIITGTGRGSMSDMEGFLEDMIRLDEGALNPTLFIQSTYNSPNGWIALQTKSTAYNQTYVHRGSSLELALLDAQLIMAEADGPRHVLAGSYDELTHDYYLIKQKIGYWKIPAPPSLQLLQAHTPGTIGGEGSAFFLCSNEPGDAKTVVADIEVLQQASPEAIGQAVQQVLERAGLQPEAIDLLLTGSNGDCRQEPLYREVRTLLPEGIPEAAFKHLCGEYDTATGFGLWLGDWIIRRQEVPAVLIQREGRKGPVRHILLVNHYILGTASVLLLSALDGGG